MGENSNVKESSIFLLTCIGMAIAPKYVAPINTLQELRNATQSFLDSLWVDNLEGYLTNLDGDASGGLGSPTLKKLAEKLAESSPNVESNYPGNEKKLKDYAKKIVKVIWNCDTEVKSLYIANLTRAFIAGQIKREEFFKLGRCIGQLSDEDLQIIRINAISNKVIKNADYIEEFTGLGLMFSVAGGSCFSKKAFRLNEYAICYEKSIKYPSESPSRATMTDIQPISEESLEEMWENRNK